MFAATVVTLRSILQLSIACGFRPHTKLNLMNPLTRKVSSFQCSNVSRLQYFNVGELFDLRCIVVNTVREGLDVST